jgi:hypothetical protein
MSGEREALGRIAFVAAGGRDAIWDTLKRSERRKYYDVVDAIATALAAQPAEGPRCTCGHVCVSEEDAALGQTCQHAPECELTAPAPAGRVDADALWQRLRQQPTREQRQAVVDEFMAPAPAGRPGGGAGAALLRETLERTKQRLIDLRYSRGQCPFCFQSPHRGDCALIPLLDDINAALAARPAPVGFDSNYPHGPWCIDGRPTPPSGEGDAKLRDRRQAAAAGSPTAMTTARALIRAGREEARWNSSTSAWRCW